MGQQELPLFHRPSADHHSTLRPVPKVVFWLVHRGHSSPCWFVPPRLARAQWPKTYLSSVSYLCPGRTGPTHVVSHPLLSSFRRRLHATRTWCTPELVKVVEKGHTLVKIHEVCHFPPRVPPDGSLCRLRQHMVKVKNKNRQGGRVGVRPWSRNGTIFFATRNGRASD